MLLPLAALLLLQLGDVASQRQISGIASPSNTIHVELDVDLSYDQTTIKVSSFVPVTVQRYNDGGSYLEGQQPCKSAADFLFSIYGSSQLDH